jgi:hypothetical protein
MTVDSSGDQLARRPPLARLWSILLTHAATTPLRVVAAHVHDISHSRGRCCCLVSRSLKQSTVIVEVQMVTVQKLHVLTMLDALLDLVMLRTCWSELMTLYLRQLAL